MTHTELCKKAASWLRNKLHCSVVLIDPNSFYTWRGETPDVIGWVNQKCILVEVKVSRSDFLADKNKQFRCCPICKHSQDKALGAWRFYVTAPGVVLDTCEIPDGWGCYELHGRSLKHLCGSVYANAQQAPFTGNRKSEVAILLSEINRMKKKEPKQ